MPPVGRNRYEDAFSVAAPEAKQNVADALAQCLAARNILRHCHVRTENELLGCPHSAVREKKPKIAIDGNGPLVDRDCVATYLLSDALERIHELVKVLVHRFPRCNFLFAYNESRMENCVSPM